jgi:ABC-type transport system substrate-binding protein
MTNLMLLNYPDKPAPEGSRLVPDAATGSPRVSRDGRTYTFTIKSGLRFSDGSARHGGGVQARASSGPANPSRARPRSRFMHDVVGADERNEGKAGAVTASPRRARVLTIRLKRREPDLPRRDRDAVLRGREAEHGDRQPRDQRLSVGRPVPDRQPHGREPGRAGAEHASTRATGPANPDRIVITTNTDVNQSLLQVRAGQIDYDQYGLPPTAHDDLSRSTASRRAATGGTSSTPASTPSTSR